MHLFVVTMLGTHDRTKAILECDLDRQYDEALSTGWRLTVSRPKSGTQLCGSGPTLAAWLDGRRGKLIRYRTETASHRWVDAAVPEYYECDT